MLSHNYTKMRVAALKLRSAASTSVLCHVIRLLPVALIIVGLKLYVLTLLLSSGLVGYHSRVAELDTPVDGATFRPRSPKSVPSTTLDPETLQKHLVLSKLNTSSLLSITPSSRNRTENSLWVFYNRVPRSGGKTLVALMEALGLDLDIQHQQHVYRSPWQRLMTGDEQKNLATWFEYNFWPKTYDRLALYINFTEHRNKYVTMRPISITMLREPIAQFMSQFYSRRNNPESAKKYMAEKEKEQPGAGRRWYWLSLEDCILKEDVECALTPGSRDFDRSVPYLCGQHEECLRLGDRWALQRAKYMTEYEYAVVGVLEGWNATLAVLEHYIPAFFQGARQRYWSDEFQDDRHVNKNPRVPKPLSDRAHKVLKTKLAAEYELYDFARQRLAKQYMNIEHLLENTTPLPPFKAPKKSLSAWDRFQMELTS